MPEEKKEKLYRRSRGNYSDEEKEAVQVQWIRELMTLADVNSNKKGGGGTNEFRTQLQKVIDMVPESWKDRIENVPFVPKTKGIHGAAIDKLVEEALSQEVAEESEAPPLQDGEVGEVQGAPEALAAPAAPAMPAAPAAAVPAVAEPAALPNAEAMEPAAAHLAPAPAPDPEEPALKRRREERQDPGQLAVQDDGEGPWKVMVATMSQQAQELQKLRSLKERMAQKIATLQAENVRLKDDLQDARAAHGEEMQRCQNIRKEHERLQAQIKSRQQGDREAFKRASEDRQQRQMSFLGLECRRAHCF